MKKVYVVSNVLNYVCMDAKELLSDKSHNVHIIGGGGTGMSGLALLLKQLGHRVSASDLVDSKYLKLLAKNGIETWSGSYPDRIDPNSVIFYSTAISEYDPERERAQRENIPMFSRHPLIRYITEKFFTVSLTGTHGKTTTTAWCAFLLEKAGIDPCALVGGSVAAWQANIRLGKGKHQNQPLLVMEADESDKSFLNIDTSIGAITNIEMDHPDHYKDIGEIEEHFEKYIDAILAQNGKVLLSIEMQEHPLIQNKLKQNREAFVIAQNFTINEKNQSLSYGGKTYKPQLAGVHNLKNASIVCALAQIFKIDAEILGQALQEFSGVERRLQLLGRFRLSETSFLDVLDDYAHHPTEIETVLTTVERMYDYVIAIWEPHRISRLLYFKEQFHALLKDFSNSGRVYLLPLYMAGEREQDFPAYKEAYQECSDNFEKLEVQDFSNLVSFLSSHPEKKIAVLFMGAGLSSEHAQRCVKELENLYAKV